MDMMIVLFLGLCLIPGVFIQGALSERQQAERRVRVRIEDNERRGR